MTDPRERYRRLRALADRADTPQAERELAASICRTMEERYGPELARLHDAPATVRVPYTHAWEESLIRHIGEFLGLEAYRVRRSSRGPWLKVVHLEGPEALTTLVEPIRADLAPRLDRLLSYSLAGFCLGAMPLPPRASEEDEPNERPEPALIDAALAAADLGRRHRPSGQRRLTEGGAAPQTS